MIGARRYNKEEDHFMISQWWKKHGYEAIPMRAYPEVGFVVEGVAAAFLYKTDSSICLLDSIIYNPDAPKDIRGYALDQVIEQVIAQAKSLGFTDVMAFTDLPVVVERSKRFGFKEEDKQYTMLIKDV